MSDIVYKKNGFSTPFLRGFKILKMPIVDENGAPTWAEMFPQNKIDELRATVGARHFASQMMLNPVSMERMRLDPGAMHIYDDDFNPQNAHIGDNTITGASVYWDPSLGHIKSDGSVCVIIYRDDKSHRIFIHDVLYLVTDDGDEHPMATQCNRVLDFLCGHGMRRICVETNGIGNALPEILRESARHRGFDIVVQNVVNNKRKSDRIIDTIEPVLSTGRLYCASRVQSTPLFAEMIGWSPVAYTTHDDGIDAVAGAILTPPTPVHPFSRNGHTFMGNTKFTIS